jgi:multiple sugar transport system permease protein
MSASTTVGHALGMKPRPKPKARTSGSLRTPIMFLAPFLIIFVAMYLVPIGFALQQSFLKTQRSGLGLDGPSAPVFDPGFNYGRIFTDEAFIASLGRVVLFGVVQVPLMLGFALLLALLLDSKSIRGKSFFRLTSFMPYAVPGVIAALMWSFLYSPSSSPINQALAPLGINIPFMSDELVLWAVANIVTWGWTGYNMIIIYSAIQTIPAEVLESAKLDGASPARIAWNIKIPMVRSAIILTAVFSIIGTAQLFNEPTVLQAISGGSIDSAFTPLMSARAAVQSQDYAYAGAQSVVLALLVGVLSFAFFKLTNRGEK